MVEETCELQSPTNYFHIKQDVLSPRDMLEARQQLLPFSRRLMGHYLGCILPKRKKQNTATQHT